MLDEVISNSNLKSKNQDKFDHLCDLKNNHSLSEMAHNLSKLKLIDEESK